MAKLPCLEMAGKVVEEVVLYLEEVVFYLEEVVFYLEEVLSYLEEVVLNLEEVVFYLEEVVFNFNLGPRALGNMVFSEFAVQEVWLCMEDQ